MRIVFWIAALTAASLPMQSRAQVTGDGLSGVYRPVGLQSGWDRSAGGTRDHTPEYQAMDETRRLHLHVAADAPGRWASWIEEDGQSDGIKLTLRELSAASAAEIVREWNTTKSGPDASSAQCAAEATVMICRIATAADNGAQTDERTSLDASTSRYVMIMLDVGYYDLQRLDDASAAD